MGILASATPYDKLLPATEFIFTLLGKIFEFMLANPVLSLFFAVSIIGVAITVFTNLKGAAQ